MRKVIIILLIVLLSGIGFAIELGPEMLSRSIQNADKKFCTEYVEYISMNQA